MMLRSSRIRDMMVGLKRKNGKVRSLEDLIHVYDNSVGGNATFLLNIPPTNEGLFHENDVKRLHEIGEFLRKAYAMNLLEMDGARVCEDEGTGTEGSAGMSESNGADGSAGMSESNGADGCAGNIKNLVVRDDYASYYRGKRREAALTVEFPEEHPISRMILKENVRLSQRVERFRVEARVDGGYATVFRGTVIGYKKIIVFEKALRTDSLRIVIEDSRMEPTITFLGIYQ